MTIINVEDFVKKLLQENDYFFKWVRFKNNNNRKGKQRYIN